MIACFKIYKEIQFLKPNQYFFNFSPKMNQNVKAIEVNLKPNVNFLQDRLLLSEIVYKLTSGIKVKCGYSTTYNFTPLILLEQNIQHYVCLQYHEFRYLMCYKDYISCKLDTNNNFPNCPALSFEEYDVCLSLDNIKFKFVKIYDTTFLMLTQNQEKVYLDIAAWKGILNIAVFLHNFVGHTHIVTFEIRNFYYNHFIPACVKLNKTKLFLSEIEGFEDFEMIQAYSQICDEICNKMGERNFHNIKIFKLFLRMKNK